MPLAAIIIGGVALVVVVSTAAVVVMKACVGGKAPPAEAPQTKLVREVQLAKAPDMEAKDMAITGQV